MADSRHITRRTALKGGAVLAVTAHAAAVAPEKPEDPRETIRRLSWQISELMNDAGVDFQFVGIQASNATPKPIHTIFEV